MQGHTSTKRLGPGGTVRAVRCSVQHGAGRGRERSAGLCPVRAWALSRELWGAPKNVLAGRQPVLSKVHSGCRVEDRWERLAGAETREKGGRLTSCKRRSGGQGMETESGLEGQQLLPQSLEKAEM